MKKFIIGTAGHIDHGKTSLVKALTGKNTDTLQEEQLRGITVNLGFTYFKLNNGNIAGLVDVPGHERFIKNMIAGASGVDLVLLVISATEGIMPQTVEHIEILSHLNIKSGIIILTKCDLVEDNMLELLKEEVKEQLQGSMFENKEIIEIDSLSGRGIEELKEKVTAISEDVDEKNSDLPPRLNIDRVFSVTGFGTVVTGTLSEGTVNIGDTLELYPLGREVKVRNIQVHEEDSKTAFAGQRTAINISNVKADEISRGFVLAKKDTLIKTEIIDAKITVAKDYKELKMWDRVRVYVGTNEVLARFVPINAKSLLSGEEGYCQLRLEKPVYIKKGDLFVLRLFSPLITIGGGSVIEPQAKRHKDLSDEKLEKLISAQNQNEDSEILQYLLQNSDQTVSIGKIFTSLGKDKEEIESIIKISIQNKAIKQIGDYYIHIDTYNDYAQSIITELNNYHSKNKLKKGILLKELRQKINTPFKEKDFVKLVAFFEEDDIIKIIDDNISLKTFAPSYNENQLSIKNIIEKALVEAQFAPPKITEIVAPSKVVDEVIESIEGESIVYLDKDLYIDKGAYDKAVEMVIDHLDKHESITLADFRNLIEASRKYALYLLDLMDNNKITKRVEDKRIRY